MASQVMDLGPGAHGLGVSGVMAFAADASSAGLLHGAFSGSVAQRRTDSLEAVYREHASFVWRSTLRLGVPAAEAEDLVQEVFLVVRRKLSRVRPEASMRAWLFSVTRGVVANWRRSRQRAERRERDAADPASTTESARHDPEATLQRRRAAALVSAFLEGLPPEQRVAFALCDIEGLSGPEVAEATGENMNVIYSRLRLARRKFRSFVAERSGDPR